MLPAVLILTAVSARGHDAVTIAVSPRQSFAPSNLNIRARVPPDRVNRMLQIAAESGEFYRRSQIQLEGDRAPATITVALRGLPGGDYVVSGILTDDRGQVRAVARENVSIIPMLGQ